MDKIRLQKIYPWLLFALCLLTAWNWQPAPAHAGNTDLLIVSPHPDDDILGYAGVILRAKSRGQSIKIVYITNGDYYGTDTGYVRESESVNAEVNAIGLNEDDLIFLGYPDGYLSNLFNYFPNQTDRFTTPLGQSTTYGSHGLGRTDYHTYRFGTPATYNGYNVILDLQDVIATYQPTHILTVSEFDLTSDHNTTYYFVQSALQSLQLQNYVPQIHTTIIHADDFSWPLPLDPSNLDPTAYYTEITNLAEISNNQLSWSQRQSSDVPLAMQSTDFLSNPKYLAISAHASQGGVTGFLGRFIHKDEFFWSKNLLGSHQPPVVNAGADQTVVAGSNVTLNGLSSWDPNGDVLSYQWQQVDGPSVQLLNANSGNPSFTAPIGLAQDVTLSFQLVVSDAQFTSLPDAVSVIVKTSSTYGNIAPLATVTASSENQQTSQTAAKAVDGVVDGSPHDYTKEWATLGQGAGAWLKLAWSNVYQVDKIILYDRPNLDDQILSATLSFNDGSTIQVGPLDNAGAGVIVTFAPKSVSQVTLTVNTVKSTTKNIGLAEIEVYGTVGSTGNHAPIANAGPDQTVAEGTNVTLNGSGSTDPDGDTLSYQWQQVSGPSVQLLSPNSATASFTAPTGLSQDAVLNFKLTVSDGQLSSSATVNITVKASQPTYGNIAPSAAVTASSENPSTGQTAVKAVDGVVDGYPGDYTKEWATLGQGAGAWLKLTWNSLYQVDKVVLFDRPNSDDQILSATLSFSDGSTVQVGSLNNAGAGVTVTFAPKSINQMTMTVNTVKSTTKNIGLAEIEVYGSKMSGDNPPVANAGTDQTVAAGAQVTLNGSGSTDPDGDVLSYQWEQVNGTDVQLLNPNAAIASFTAPTGLTQDLILNFKLTVSDGQLSSSATVNVTVKTAQVYGNIASLAAVAASSETPWTGQTAAKAVDGVVNGYPGDYTKEWATLGESAGAWLKLTWSSVFVIDRIYLFDRPNSDDQILSATLSFSDGSTIQVGPLDNAGAGLEVTFSPKSINQMTLTVNTVKSTTKNIGLAEIEVFGSPQ